MWSEKTTVCRIFSCQRIGEALSLAAAGGPAGILSGAGATASLQTRGLASLTNRPASLPRARCHSPELTIVTSATPKCKLKRQSFLIRGNITLEYLTLVSGASPGPPRLASLAQPLGPRTVHARRPHEFGPIGLRAGAWGAPASAKAGGLRQSSEVENTGLEPVTSWLQTRRSPS